MTTGRLCLTFVFYTCCSGACRFYHQAVQWRTYVARDQIAFNLQQV